MIPSKKNVIKVNRLVCNLPGVCKDLGWSPAPHKLGNEVQAYDPGIQEAKAGGSGFKVILSYIAS